MKAKEKLSGCKGDALEPRKNAAQRVFETAQELFYQRGIRAVGVDEIVSQAGVTKPSLYRSFASKDELVTACLDKYAEDAWAQIDAAIAAAGDDPRAQLDAFIGHYADQIRQPDFRGCPMANTAVEFPEPGYPGRTKAETCKVEVRARLLDMTRRLPAHDPEALADGLLMLVEGAYSTYHVFGSQGPASTLVQSARTLIDAYVANGSQRSG
ncbi:TetR/AcrR family transcriptional regulator [Sphingomonas cavernae]|uniref:TetR/AcrR family transcriptional regulator n=1 Tax=Sphingomonas cavernae TaxID=2320861 RepID=A0A418WP05_9SPHN|nr:TetR/AcrR family transcriptional regulator [Sphingomonas cavernae]RJF92950.1 TetR/AcrR family transcriptional regulator [Sphingomonas cavernae]